MSLVDEFWKAQRGEQFLLVGFSDLTGLATAKLFSKMGVAFKISDSKPLSELEPQLAALPVRPSDVFSGPQEPAQLEGVTQVVLSPGVPRAIPLIREACARGIPVWSDYDFFYPLYANKRIAAVTGTDGKTTTTTLLGHLLKPHRSVVVAGNIGVPIAAIYDELLRSDVVVLELSSFMLEDVKRFRADVSTVLNIAEDHVDRYRSMDEYVETKRNVLRFARPGDAFVKNLDDGRIASWELGHLEVRTVSRRVCTADARVFPGGLAVLGAKLPLNALKIRGAHLIDDVLTAALMATSLGVPAAQGLALAGTFAGVPHRFEYAGTLSGVDVIDDSKATSVQAVNSALESLKGRTVVLILGGQDKHLDPTALDAHSAHLRSVVGYGEAGRRLLSAFSTVPTHYVADFAGAVKLACGLVRGNDVLLLSPVGTSFDQHRDYRERGETFRALARMHLSVT